MPVHYDVEAYRREAQARSNAALDELKAKGSPEGEQWAEVQRFFRDVPIEAIAACLLAQNSGARLEDTARAAGLATGSVFASMQASFEHNPAATMAFIQGFTLATSAEPDDGIRANVDVYPMESGRA